LDAFVLHRSSWQGKGLLYFGFEHYYFLGDRLRRKLHSLTIQGHQQNAGLTGEHHSARVRGDVFTQRFPHCPSTDLISAVSFGLFSSHPPLLLVASVLYTQKQLLPFLSLSALWICKHQDSESFACVPHLFQDYEYHTV